MYTTLTYLAGAGLLAIAAANFFAPRMLRYGDNLARVSPIVRQIFLVHCAYIVAILFGQAALSLPFPKNSPAARPSGVRSPPFSRASGCRADSSKAGTMIARRRASIRGSISSSSRRFSFSAACSPCSRFAPPLTYE